MKVTVTKNYYDEIEVGEISEIVFDAPLECGSVWRKEAITEDGYRIRKEAAYGYEGTHQYSAWSIVEPDGSAHLRWF